MLIERLADAPSAVPGGIGTKPLGNPSGFVAFLAWATTVGGVAMLGYGSMRWAQKIVRDLGRQCHEADLSLCLRCGYCLIGLPEEHACPECGRHFELKHVQRSWQKWLRRDPFGITT